MVDRDLVFIDAIDCQSTIPRQSRRSFLGNNWNKKSDDGLMILVGNLVVESQRQKQHPQDRRGSDSKVFYEETGN